MCSVGSATCDQEMAVVGKFGSDVRDARGEHLIRFCMDRKLTICNTYEDAPVEDRFTCRANGGSSLIDYLITNKPSIVTQCATKNLPVKPTNHISLNCSIRSAVLARPRLPKPIRWSTEDLAGYLTNCRCNGA